MRTCTPITFAICSNRPSQIYPAVERTLEMLSEQDRLIVVVDTDAPVLDGIPAHPALTVLHNDFNRGLAYSRNRAMKECAMRYLVFIDDDIVLTRSAVDATRDAFADGADIVGTRISADFNGQGVPWCLTDGQLHYLGVHNPTMPASIWGGCLAVDVERARILGVQFDESLGRVGTSLGSAEDTTFVRHMVHKGAHSAVLHDVAVTHTIPAERLQFPYLFRRAYWQGRSEVRRNDAKQGLLKEWKRNRNTRNASALRRTTLAVIYTGAVAAGAVREDLQARLRQLRGPQARSVMN
ncbi:glycosyltransferase [Streptomyces sp. NBC_01381]|uniref:glycosyltransferase family 2 protein n=1 Tax=Streptomyces sp. NBC_01381 TaxID=2903845 RepID=UPI00225AC081|nr:glycosyltransferase [Streptomyces sp. NBC_01381]MCX4666481.1 glycosyltransferase [Streptomyces sp. NBC_01381]